MCGDAVFFSFCVPAIKLLCFRLRVRTRLFIVCEFMLLSSGGRSISHLRCDSFFLWVHAVRLEWSLFLGGDSTIFCERTPAIKLCLFVFSWRIVPFKGKKKDGSI